jgi:hypothetical protein
MKNNNYYYTKYRYLGSEFSIDDRTNLISFMNKYEIYHDGWNFLKYNNNEWFITKFKTTERKDNFYAIYWASDERRNIYDQINGKPWNPIKWRQLDKSNFYKKQILYLRKNNTEVFTYEN